MSVFNSIVTGYQLAPTTTLFGAFRSVLQAQQNGDRGAIEAALAGARDHLATLGAQVGNLHQEAAAKRLMDTGNAPSQEDAVKLIRSLDFQLRAGLTELFVEVWQTDAKQAADVAELQHWVSAIQADRPANAPVLIRWERVLFHDMARRVPRDVVIQHPELFLAPEVTVFQEGMELIEQKVEAILQDPDSNLGELERVVEGIGSASSFGALRTAFRNSPLEERDLVVAAIAQFEEAYRAAIRTLSDEAWLAALEALETVPEDFGLRSQLAQRFIPGSDPHVVAARAQRVERASAAAAAEADRRALAAAIAPRPATAATFGDYTMMVRRGEEETPRPFAAGEVIVIGSKPDEPAVTFDVAADASVPSRPAVLRRDGDKVFVLVPGTPSEDEPDWVCLEGVRGMQPLPRGTETEIPLGFRVWFGETSFVVQKPVRRVQFSNLAVVAPYVVVSGRGLAADGGMTVTDPNDFRVTVKPADGLYLKVDGVEVRDEQEVSLKPDAKIEAFFVDNNLLVGTLTLAGGEVTTAGHIQTTPYSWQLEEAKVDVDDRAKGLMNADDLPTYRYYPEGKLGLGKAAGIYPRFHLGRDFKVDDSAAQPRRKFAIPRDGSISNIAIVGKDGARLLLHNSLEAGVLRVTVIEPDRAGEAAAPEPAAPVEDPATRNTALIAVLQADAANCFRQVRAMQSPVIPREQRFWHYTLQGSILGLRLVDDDTIEVLRYEGVGEPVSIGRITRRLPGTPVTVDAKQLVEVQPYFAVANASTLEERDGKLTLHVVPGTGLTLRMGTTNLTGEGDLEVTAGADIQVFLAETPIGTVTVKKGEKNRYQLSLTPGSVNVPEALQPYLEAGKSFFKFYPTSETDPTPRLRARYLLKKEFAPRGGYSGGKRYALAMNVPEGQEGTIVDRATGAVVAVINGSMHEGIFTFSYHAAAVAASPELHPMLERTAYEFSSDTPPRLRARAWLKDGFRLVGKPATQRDFNMEVPPPAEAQWEAIFDETRGQVVALVDGKADGKGDFYFAYGDTFTAGLTTAVPYFAADGDEELAAVAHMQALPGITINEILTSLWSRRVAGQDRVSFFHGRFHLEIDFSNPAEAATQGWPVRPAGSDHIVGHLMTLDANSFNFVLPIQFEGPYHAQPVGRTGQGDYTVQITVNKANSSVHHYRAAGREEGKLLQHVSREAGNQPEAHFVLQDGDYLQFADSREPGANYMYQVRVRISAVNGKERITLEPATRSMKGSPPETDFEADTPEVADLKRRLEKAQHNLDRATTSHTSARDAAAALRQRPGRPPTPGEIQAANEQITHWHGEEQSARREVESVDGLLRAAQAAATAAPAPAGGPAPAKKPAGFPGRGKADADSAKVFIAAVSVRGDRASHTIALRARSGHKLSLSGEGQSISDGLDVPPGEDVIVHKDGRPIAQLKITGSWATGFCVLHHADLAGGAEPPAASPLAGRLPPGPRPGERDHLASGRFGYDVEGTSEGFGGYLRGVPTVGVNGDRRFLRGLNPKVGYRLFVVRRGVVPIPVQGDVEVHTGDKIHVLGPDSAKVGEVTVGGNGSYVQLENWVVGTGGNGSPAPGPIASRPPAAAPRRQAGAQPPVGGAAGRPAPAPRKPQVYRPDGTDSLFEGNLQNGPEGLSIAVIVPRDHQASVGRHLYPSGRQLISVEDLRGGLTIEPNGGRAPGRPRSFTVTVEANGDVLIEKR